MARIAGIDIPPQKRVVIALVYIHGIGQTTAEKLVKMANINPDTRVKDLSEEDVARLRQIIDRPLLLLERAPVLLEFRRVLAAQQRVLPLLHLDLEGHEHVGYRAFVRDVGLHRGAVDIE